MTTIGMVEMCVMEKLDRPDAVPIMWERLDLDRDGIEGCRVTVVDPDPPVFKSGPRKGKPNWSKATGLVSRIVTDEEVDRFAVEWSFRTGKCADCTGTGERFKSWHHIHGTTMEPCPHCDGSGQLARRSDPT